MVAEENRSFIFMFFIICFAILGIGLTFCIWGAHDNFDGMLLWGCGISLIVILIGFGLIGGTSDFANKTYQITNLRKIKTDSALVIEYINRNKVGQIQTNDVYIYNNSDKIEFLNVIQKFNAYGGMINETIEIDQVDLLKKKMGMDER